LTRGSHCYEPQNNSEFGFRGYLLDSDRGDASPYRNGRHLWWTWSCFIREDGLMTSDMPSKDFPASSSGSVADKEGAPGVAGDRLAEEVSSLRADMAKMHDILSNFASEAGGQAARTARNVGQTVVSQVGSTASGLAHTTADIASSATDQLKTFATELEDVARSNPLGALAGALAVGIIIGLIMRGRG
jgi:ElaB/YqjD/DUF883 family membrane-anchored ribosome-binding protein